MPARAAQVIKVLETCKLTLMPAITAISHNMSALGANAVRVISEGCKFRPSAAALQAFTQFNQALDVGEGR
jgi:hypothetical protein